MKIYTRCVYGWRPDGTLAQEEANSFEYEGPLALCKDSPSPPPPPDFPAAAQATSQGSVQAAIANQLLNMRNTQTPLGSRSFSPSGTFDIPSVGGQPGFQIPQFSESVNMTPEGQNLYNQQMGLSTGLLGLGQGALNRTSQTLSSAPGQMGGQIQSGLNRTFDRGRIEDALYNRATARLDPTWNQREQALRTQLANQGLVPGGEAYTNAMRDLNFGRNDAYSSALNDAIGMGGQEMSRQFGVEQGAGQFANQAQQQRFQQDAYLRGLPLSELNAIRTGAQPQMPQFQGVPGAGGVQGPNMLGAAQAGYGAGMDQYNAQVGQNNALMSGLFGLGGAVLGGPLGGKMFGF